MFAPLLLKVKSFPSRLNDKVASLAASGHNDEAFTSYEAMVPLTDILEPMIRPVPGSVIRIGITIGSRDPQPNLTQASLTFSCEPLIPNWFRIVFRIGPLLSKMLLLINDSLILNTSEKLYQFNDFNESKQYSSPTT